MDLKNPKKFLEMLKDISSGNDELYKMLVEDARANNVHVGNMSDDEYKSFAKKYVAEKVMPRVDTGLKRNYGTQGWSFAVTVNKNARKYLERKFNRDFDTLKKFYGDKKPLLALADNRDELIKFAALQDEGTGDVTVELLRDEILNAWEEQKERNVEAAKKEEENELAKARNKIADEYRKNNGMMKFLAPGVYNTAVKYAKTGGNVKPSEWAQSVGADALSTAGSLVFPSLAGARAARLGVGFSPFAAGAAEGAVEAAREFASPNEKLNGGKIFGAAMSTVTADMLTGAAATKMMQTPAFYQAGRELARKNKRGEKLSELDVAKGKKLENEMRIKEVENYLKTNPPKDSDELALAMKELGERNANRQALEDAITTAKRAEAYERAIAKANKPGLKQKLIAAAPNVVPTGSMRVGTSLGDVAGDLPEEPEKWLRSGGGWTLNPEWKRYQEWKKDYYGERK